MAAEADCTLRYFKAFFRSLDLISNFELQFATAISEEEKALKSSKLNSAINRLEWHQTVRFQSLIGGRYTLLEDISIESEADVVEFLSDIQLPVYRDFFKKGKAGLNQDMIAEAFCRFANGELRVGKSLDESAWNCEPDSTIVFHFANHALWSILAGVHVRVWSQILPCCAASQEFYLRAYHPDGPPPYQMQRYGPWNYKNTPPLKKEEIRITFAKYKKMSLQSLSEQLDRNLVAMLKGG